MMNLSNQTMRWTGIGLFLGFVTLIGLALFTQQKMIEFLTVLLAVIAAVYIGFAIVDSRKLVKWMEIGTAVLFILVALAGLWFNPWLLVLGYIGHGLWDWLHHADHIDTQVASWYPPLCAIYDFVVGIGLIFWII